MLFSSYKTEQRAAIRQLFVDTFTRAEGESEGLLVGNLAHNLLTKTGNYDLYCFVANENEHIIGSVIFSRLRFESAINAFLLAPLAIRTDWQRRGIGQKLLCFSLDKLKENSIELVFTYGNPDFYAKVGFCRISPETIRPPYSLSRPEGWLALSFTAAGIRPLAGSSFCVEALKQPELW